MLSGYSKFTGYKVDCNVNPTQNIWLFAEPRTNLFLPSLSFPF